MSNQPVIGVSQSKNISEKIKSICVNYMKVMIKCAEEDEFRANFLKYPHYYLNVEVGMVIPDEVKIVFDAKELGWPITYIKVADGDKYEVREGFFSNEIIADMASGVKIDENVQLKHQSEIDFMVHEKLKECDVVIKMPFIDVKADMLGDIQFEDNYEILLTGA